MVSFEARSTKAPFIFHCYSYLFLYRDDAQAGPHGELQHLGAGPHPPLPDTGLQGLSQRQVRGQLLMV